MIKIPRANPNGMPQNLEGIGVVAKTLRKPGPYKFATPMRAEANIPAGTAKLRRGPQKGLELRMETRLLRTASRLPYCMKIIVI